MGAGLATAGLGLDGFEQAAMGLHKLEVQAVVVVVASMKLESGDFKWAAA